MHKTSAAALMFVTLREKRPGGCAGTHCPIPRFSQNEKSGISPLSPTPISAHYRESPLCELRADVTKTENLSVENFPAGGLAAGSGALDVQRNGLGEPKSESTPLFQTNRGS